MKRIKFLMLSLLVLLGFTVTSSQSQPIVLKAVTFSPKNEPHLADVPTFIEMVSKESGGRLKIDWVGGPEVIQTFDQAQALKNGVIDMLPYYPFAYFKPIMPVANAKGLSLFPAWEERKKGIYDLWVKVFREKANVEYLGSFHSMVPMRLYTTVKIETLNDFRGKKIRSMPLYVPMLKALEVAPITTPPTDIYTALERKTVDGFIWGGYGITVWGWNEVIKYVIEPGFFQLEAVCGVNLDKFNKLPKDLQEVLRKCTEKMELLATQNAMKTAEAELEKLQKDGKQICKLQPVEIKRLFDLAYEVTWDQILKDDPVYGPQFKQLSSK
jgi:TRAP-type transport system periplasmic protein